MDRRLQFLSYSGRSTLHSCPRKFQLQKLGSVGEDTDSDGSRGITLLYGGIVGEGIQQLLTGKSLDTVIWEAYLTWTLDLELRDEKRNKSFYSAVTAFNRFDSMISNGLLQGYKVLQYKGKPACELGFAITFPSGFIYRGWVDCVMQHEESGEVVVIEGKTTWFSAVNPAQYKNSSQAIGYSIVLDVLFPELSSYKVVYLVYKTKDMNWERFEFTKSYLARAQWIQELLFDVEDIERYDAAGIFPMRGESCVSFGRECEFISSCTLNTRFLIKSLDAGDIEKLDRELEQYDIVLTLDDLIEAQLRKS